MFRWLDFRVAVLNPSPAARGRVPDRAGEGGESEKNRGMEIGLVDKNRETSMIPRPHPSPLPRCRRGGFACAKFVCAAVLSLFATIASSIVGAQSLGRPATAAEIKAWDIDVRPDFQGLPVGSGSVAKGQQVWEAKCESCHGVFGESNEVFTPMIGYTTKADTKTGRTASLKGELVPQRTTLMKLSQLSTLWDYINRAMPWNAPKTMTTEEVYAVTAYVLHLADIVPSEFTLSDKNVRDVQAMLPNRDGMTRAHGLWRSSDKPDVQGSSCMSNCAPQVKISSNLPDYARNQHGNLSEQMRLIGSVRGADTTRPATAHITLVTRTNTLTTSVTAYATETKTETTIPDAAKLAQKHTCFACHGLQNKLVGPAMSDIYKKYKDAKDVVALLGGKIKAGGSGVWGSIPMPPQTHVPDADIRAIAEWLAAGKF